MHNDLITLNDLTDKELIRLVQNRDEAAFAELISRYSPRVWRIVVAKSRQHRNAEEIRTDIWMAVWKNIGGLRKIDSFGAWLRRIAYNACNRYYSSHRRSRDEIPQSDTDLAEHIDQDAPTRYQEAQLRADAREAVHHLPHRVRPIAVLYYLESWSVKDIAQKLNLAIGTVKTRLREVRSLLRKEFDVDPQQGDIMSLESVQLSNKNKIIEGYLPKDAITRFGKGYVFDFAYSPDGTRLALASTIGVWLIDVATGKEINLLTGHTGHLTGHTYYVDKVVFSADGRTLASLSKGYHGDDTIRLWDAVTGESKAVLTEGINSPVFSPDGKTLASGGSGGAIHLWDGGTGELKTTLIGHTAPVTMLAFNPDGSTLASGGLDEVIRFWDVTTGELQLTFAAHANTVNFLKYSPDGEVLVSQGGDNNVCLWNARTGEFLRILTTHKDASSIDFSSDGKTLVSVNSDANVRLWNPYTGEQLKTKKQDRNLEKVQYSPDGKIFACSEDYGEATVLLFDADTGELLHDLKMPGYADSVTGFQFSPDGYTLAVKTENEIYFWDVNTGELEKTITGYSDVVSTIVYSPDGKTLVSLDDIVRIWDLDMQKLVKTLLKKTLSVKGSIRAIAYSPDGETLACGTMDMIVLWSVSEWEKRKVLKGHTNGVSSVAFSPDGQTLASGSWDGTIRLWNAHTGEHLKIFDRHASYVSKVLFSPNGQILASTEDDETIRFRHVATGELLNTIKMETDVDVFSIDFSPDGTTLVTTDSTLKIKFWDVTTAEQKSITHLEAEGYYAVLSPDGNTLASADTADAIFLWDVATGKLLKTLKGHISNINSIAFSPDGKTLASCCRDSTVILWDLTK
ncbi:MAG: sigma-70 family RNA polymerase sigma factor [Candidatus Poribacteria bacterium]|nr:sigma-70 family RNA polymerase sigma factor [Candidatus Poribacteria bacterium]